jgi:peptidylprolyl isomerase
VGESITASWSSAVEAPKETAVTTLVKGDGDPIADGDTVSAYMWVGDGAAQKQVFSDYDTKAPESLPNDPDQLGPVFSALLEGQTYGSRVVAVTRASDVFGTKENQFGIDPDSSLVIVADLVEKQPVAPTPTDDKAHDASPDEQPTVVEDGGKPTGLDFSGIDEPALDTPVQRVVLKEGTGAVVKASDTVTVDYLGATYDAKSPFDESYSGGQPLTSPLTGLIQGWSIGLTGVKVGSRVLLQIPPGYGYGAQGSGDTIPGNATLWFVIDVLEAK